MSDTLAQEFAAEFADDGAAPTEGGGNEFAQHFGEGLDELEMRESEAAHGAVQSQAGLFGDMPRPAGSPAPSQAVAQPPQDDKPWWFVGPTGSDTPMPGPDPAGIERVGTDLHGASTLELAGEEAMIRSADALVRGLEAAKGKIVKGAGQIGLGIMRRDPRLVGRGAVKATAGTLSGAIQTLPPVAAMSGAGGSLAELMAEEEAAGRELPAGVETLNLPNEAFAEFDRQVGGRVAGWTGNEDMGEIATILAAGVAFKGLSKGEAMVRSRLPSSFPGSTRPGGVRVRDAGPLAEPSAETGLARTSPSRAPLEARGLPGPKALEGRAPRVLATGETTAAPLARVPLQARQAPKTSIVGEPMPEAGVTPYTEAAPEPMLSTDAREMTREEFPDEGPMWADEHGNVHKGHEPASFDPNDSATMGRIRQEEVPGRAWRGMSAGEWAELAGGRKTYGETNGARGESLAHTPSKAAAFAKTGKAEILVEFGGTGRMRGERSANVLSGENVTRAWKYDAKTGEFREIHRGPAKPQAGADPASRAAAIMEELRGVRRDVDALDARGMKDSPEMADLIDRGYALMEEHKALATPGEAMPDFTKVDIHHGSKVEGMDVSRLDPAAAHPADRVMSGPQEHRATYFTPDKAIADTYGKTTVTSRLREGARVITLEEARARYGHLKDGATDAMLADGVDAIAHRKPMGGSWKRGAKEPVDAWEVGVINHDALVAPAVQKPPEIPTSDAGTRVPLKGKRRKGEAGQVAVPDPRPAYRAVDKAFDATQRFMGKGIDAAFRKFLDPLTDVRIPRGKGKTTSLREAFQQPIKRVGGKALDIERRRSGGADWAYHEAQLGYRKAVDALADAAPEVEQAFADWASSRASTFPKELEEHRPMLEGITEFLKQITSERVKAGRLSEAAAAQFERHLPRMFRDAAKAGSRTRADVPRLDKNFMIHNGMAAILDATKLADLGVEELARSIDPNVVITTEGNNLGVKFPEFRRGGEENPGFREKYERFLDVLSERLATERREANAQFAGAVRGGRVDLAAKGAKQRQQARTLGSIIKDTFEPLPRELIEELGEIPPAERIGHAIYRGMLDLVNNDALNDLSTAVDEAGRPYASRQARAGDVQLNNERLGPLDKMWVEPNLAEYLNGVVEGGPKREGFGYDMLQGMKSNLTIMSPAAIGRQYAAVPQFLLLYGIKNPTHPAALKAFSRALKAVYGEKTPEFAEAMQEGITGRVTFTDVELDNGSGAGMFGKRTYGPGRYIMQPWLATKAGRKATQFMERRYSEPDRVARAFGWFYGKYHLGMTDQQAREYVNKHTQNYAEVGPLVDWARFTWFMSPFAAFKAESPRILANTMRERPLDAILATQWNKIIKAAVAGLAALGATAAFTDEEEDAAEEIRGSQQIPFTRNDKGQIVLLDTRYVDLWGDYTPRKGRIGDKGGFLRYVAENLGMDVNPLVAAGLAISDGRTKWGDRIWFETDDTYARLGKSMAFAMQSYAPPLTPIGVEPSSMNSLDPREWEKRPAGWHAREIQSAYTGEPHTESRDPPSMTMALLTGLIGLRLTPIDVAKELDRIERQKGRAVTNRKEAFKAGRMTRKQLFEELLNVYDEASRRRTAARTIRSGGKSRTRVPLRAR